MCSKLMSGARVALACLCVVIAVWVMLAFVLRVFLD